MAEPKKRPVFSHSPGPPSSDPETFTDWLRSTQGYTIATPAPNGRWVGVMRLLFHWSLHEGLISAGGPHRRRFCYQTFDAAADAMAEWAARCFEGEPAGWHRDPFTGRRRPGGRVEEEYIEA